MRNVWLGIVAGALFATTGAAAAIHDGNNPPPCDGDTCGNGGTDNTDPLPPTSGTGEGESGGVGTDIGTPPPAPGAPSVTPLPIPAWPDDSPTYDWENPPGQPLPGQGTGTSPTGDPAGGGSGGGGSTSPPQAPWPACTMTHASKPDAPAPTCPVNQVCSACGPKKKAACQTCKNIADARDEAINYTYNNCKDSAKNEAIVHCHLGELPSGAANGIGGAITGTNFPVGGVVMVGNSWAAAAKCYKEHGYKWWKFCPTAYQEENCVVDLFNNTWCSPTKGWKTCTNGWLGGNSGFEGQFGIELGPKWETPVGVEVSLQGEFQGTVTWAPSEGTLALCEKRKTASVEKQKKLAAQCQAKVNADFKGGKQCAF